MGARLSNARKKTKRRAHKEARAALAAKTASAAQDGQGSGRRTDERQSRQRG